MNGLKVLGWPKSYAVFHTMALVVLICLQLHPKQFCYCIVTAVILACVKKNLLKLVNVCTAILILKMEEGK